MMRRTVTRAAAKSALLLAVNITAGSAIAAPGHDTAAQQAEAHEAAGKATHEWGEKSVPQFEPKYQAQFRAPLVSTGYEFETSTLADGLVHPWSIEELPDGQGYLVTEREGRLRLVKKDGSVSHPIKGVPKVENRKPDSSWPTQAGLLDVKLGPSFAKDRHVYLTYSKPVGDDQSVTAAARGKLNADLTALEDVQDIFVQSPPSKTRMHYGSRIIFDDHGHLFITTGEHSSLKTRGFAQHLDKM